MKGDAKVIEFLNKALGNELVAINQYFLHSRMCNDWGFKKLGEKEYKKSIEDMKQADKLIERILFLEGLPNLQSLGKILIGENAQEILNCDRKLQTTKLEQLREAIAICESLQDYVSRDLLEDFLEEEEEHLDWIDTQKDLINATTLENYLQSMI
ncbi:bacterioferritin [Teredinibacter sp. KSP-S5-2]|uniref:bacterioferritin n=1 Tax=Teredinibacter sp. KSP-S5-2 TaxID=3034506 RepID=UPI002934135F|nr:bacterioferritin [Teredinibacter sp. KSP-S5-2]WNO10189.1 bacterioferritin [Teredinibacter sp. KSP-S5-2]